MPTATLGHRGTENAAMGLDIITYRPLAIEADYGPGGRPSDPVVQTIPGQSEDFMERGLVTANRFPTRE